MVSKSQCGLPSLSLCSWRFLCIPFFVFFLKKFKPIWNVKYIMRIVIWWFQVSKRMNDICMNMLNGAFGRQIKTTFNRFQSIKASMPRRESARRNHPLACECDIIETCYMRLSLLQMSMGKHIERGHCCFFPGAVSRMNVNWFIQQVNRIHFSISRYSMRFTRFWIILVLHRDCSVHIASPMNSLISPPWPWSTLRIALSPRFQGWRTSIRTSFKCPQPQRGVRESLIYPKITWS